MIFRLLVSLFVGMVVSPSYAYQWPIADVNVQHAINSTMGEYRDTGIEGCAAPCPHFHDGVDIPGAQSEDVFAVLAGTVRAIGENLVEVETVGGVFRYIHIVPDGALRLDASVNLGARLGSIDGEAHVHLKELDTGRANVLNNLRAGGLSPYADASMPVVLNVELFDANRFEGPPLGEVIPTGVRELDVRSRARDRQNMGFGSQNTGVHRIGYQVFDAQTGQLLLDRFPRQTYNSLPVGLLRFPGSAYDTTISRGSSGGVLDAFYFANNVVDADTPLDLTGFQDGRYNVCVIAADIAGNVGDPITQTGASCTSFTILRPPQASITTNGDLNFGFLRGTSTIEACL